MARLERAWDHIKLMPTKTKNGIKVKDQELTDKQKVFIDYLFGESRGNVADAKKLAGLGGTIDSVLQDTVDTVILRSNRELCLLAVKAVQQLNQIMDDPLRPGADKQLKALLQVLDRSGLSKVEKSEIEHKVPPNSVLVLPSKASLDAEVQADDD